MTFQFLDCARGERPGDRMAEVERRRMIAKRDKRTARNLSRDLGPEIGKRLRDGA